MSTTGLRRAGALFSIVGLLGLGVVYWLSFFWVSTGTRMGETLLPILLFPLLVPMVIYGVGATARLLAGRPVAEVASNLRMLGAFALIALAVGAVLFRFVVED